MLSPDARSATDLAPSSEENHSRSLDAEFAIPSLQRALEGLVRMVEARSATGVLGSILLLDAEGAHLRHGAAPSLPDAYNAAIDGIAIGVGVGSCGTAAATNAPVYVSDIDSDPLWKDFRELALAHGLRACWSTPIRDPAQAVLGTFAMYYPAPREPSPADLEFVGLIAQSASLIIARERAQAALALSEERLRLATEAAEVGFWDVDVVNDVLIWPPRVKAMFGISPDVPVTMRDFYEGLHPDDRDATASVYAAAADPELRALYDAEYRTVGKEDGVVRWVAAKGRGVFDASGRCTRVIGTALDITSRKRTEAALQELNATLQERVRQAIADRDRTWNNARDLLVVLDVDGVFRAANPAWTTLLGWSEAELVGRSYLDFIHPDDHPESNRALETATNAALPVHENRYRHRVGGYRTVSWVAAPEGELIYASGRDVTEERARREALAQAEDALRQSQKMEAVGQLTGGIAHDFNNMLAVVIGSLDLLSRRIGGGDARAQRYADAAADGARRAAALTQRLLAFSRQQPLQPEPIDVNKVVSNMGDLLRHSLGGDVRLETVLAGGLWRTHADPNQLENVILNLAINARDAMAGGGRLTIETQNAHLDERYTAAEPGLPAGQYVLVGVTDTGAGMAPEVIAKAFDPFFTTKAVGKGTGLGLSQVYGFVKQSGGHVKIYSEPGQGTTIKVYLPRMAGDARPDADPAADAMPPLGEHDEVVLVVEDEPAVRQFSVDALRELGYRVLEASHAQAALALLEAHPEIELLFTDVVMPDVNGARLAEAARRARPGLKVLFTTGYTRNAVVHNGVLDPGVQLIGKPFAIDALAAKVREVLEDPGPPAVAREDA